MLPVLPGGGNGPHAPSSPGGCGSRQPVCALRPGQETGLGQCQTFSAGSSGAAKQQQPEPPAMGTTLSPHSLDDVYIA